MECSNYSPMAANATRWEVK